MAQIFISHSAKDKALVDFLSRCAATTKVRLVIEEFEKIISGAVNATKIGKDIEESKAVFILLGPDIQDSQHTRDWVLWETGVASKKEVWVFEKASSVRVPGIVIPKLNHYVVFEPIDTWFPYMTRIIQSYDDSSEVGAALGTGAAAGFLFGGAGVVFGALAGLAIADQTKIRPTGVTSACPKCQTIVQAHLPANNPRYRCPVCNSVLQLPLQPVQASSTRV